MVSKKKIASYESIKGVLITIGSMVYQKLGEFYKAGNYFYALLCTVGLAVIIAVMLYLNASLIVEAIAYYHEKTLKILKEYIEARLREFTKEYA